MYVLITTWNDRKAIRRTSFRFGWTVLSSAAVILLSSGLALCQTSSPGLTSLPSAEQVIQRAQDPFTGSLPQGKATSEVIDLVVQDALDRGLKYNLGLYFSERATEQTRAEPGFAPSAT